MTVGQTELNILTLYKIKFFWQSLINDRTTNLLLNLTVKEYLTTDQHSTKLRQQRSGVVGFFDLQLPMTQ